MSDCDEGEQLQYQDGDDEYEYQDGDEDYEYCDDEEVEIEYCSPTQTKRARSDSSLFNVKPSDMPPFFKDGSDIAAQWSAIFVNLRSIVVEETEYKVKLDWDSKNLYTKAKVTYEDCNSNKQCSFEIFFQPEEGKFFPNYPPRIYPTGICSSPSIHILFQQHPLLTTEYWNPLQQMRVLLVSFVKLLDTCDFEMNEMSYHNPALAYRAHNDYMQLHRSTEKARLFPSLCIEAKLTLLAEEKMSYLQSFSRELNNNTELLRLLVKSMVGIELPGIPFKPMMTTNQVANSGIKNRGIGYGGGGGGGYIYHNIQR